MLGQRKLLLDNYFAAVERDFVYFDAMRYVTNTLNYSCYTTDEWFNGVLATHSDRRVLPQTEVLGRTDPSRSLVSRSSYLSIVCTLPPRRTRGEVVGAILLLIDADGVNSILRGDDAPRAGTTHLVDSTGRVLAGLQENRAIVTSVRDRLAATEGVVESVGDGEFAAIFTHSEFRDWTYISLMPRAIVTGQASRMRTLILIATACSVAIGLVAAVLLTARRLRPLREIASMISGLFSTERPDAQEGFAYVRDGVEQIITDNRTLTETVSTEREMLGEELMRRLLSFEVHNEAELCDSLAHAGITIGGRSYLSIVIGLPAGGAARLERDEVWAAVRSTFESRGGVVPVSGDSIAVVLGFDNADDRYCTTLVNGLVRNARSRVESDLRERVRFGIGSLCRTLSDVQLSYSQAIEAIERLEEDPSSGHLLWYRDIESTSGTYDYPVETEQRLATATRCGDRKSALDILASLYRSNFVARRLTGHMRRQLYLELLGTVTKVREDLSVREMQTDLVSRADLNLDAEGFFTRLRQSYLVLCDQVDRRKKSHNTALVQDILAFIDKNYPSPAFGGCTIASEFGISESYLSRFFKEQVGERFIDYLQRLRIRSACEIMVAEDIPLEEVARRVGYSSAYSFRRGFKNTMGVLPNDYRTLRRQPE